MLAYKSRILPSKVHIGKFHKVWPERSLINVWMIKYIYISMEAGKPKETLKLCKIKSQSILALFQSFKFGCKFLVKGCEAKL